MTLDSSSSTAENIKTDQVQLPSDLGSNSRAAAAVELSQNIFADTIRDRQRGSDTQSALAQAGDTTSQTTDRGENKLETNNAKPPAGADMSDPFQKYNERYKPLKKDGPSDPKDEDRPQPDVKPEVKPDSKPTDTPDKKPEADIKSRYETDDVKKAVELAAKNGLPLVVHVGASWCGPCQQMESNAWPGVERDANLNKKAVYLHIDGDKARRMQGEDGTLARNLMKNVTGYPTIKAFAVTPGADGASPSLTQKGSQVGGMSEGQLKDFIRKNLK